MHVDAVNIYLVTRGKLHPVIATGVRDAPPAAASGDRYGRRHGRCGMIKDLAADILAAIRRASKARAEM